ncbi:ribonuclease III domain-containing protein [Anaerocolumna sp.]|uniref:Mini-ribonuclease 3 n=1 Tax=Anaerocolumna sp. TaxID=2041569 RepID=UPI002F3F8412
MEKELGDSRENENAEDNCNIINFIKSYMDLPEADIRTYSPLTLAFIGDVIYDLIMRTIVVEKGNAPVNKLHKKVSSLVKAPAQMELFHKIEEELTEEELGVYKRGRNAKSFTSAKNASITEYRIATGLEALIGYLYLTNQFARILELVKLGLDNQPRKEQ